MQDNKADFNMIESVLRGNFLLKQNWRQDVKEGRINTLAGVATLNMQNGEGGDVFIA